MPSNIANWVKRRPLVTYFFGAYAITWILVSPLVAAALGFMATPVPAAWHAFGALGPILSAFGVTAVVGGKDGLAQLVHSIGQWRIGIGWALIALLSPFAMFFLSAAILLLFGQPWPDFGQIAARFSDSTWLLAWFLGSAAYGLGEEPGWRGFALPRLQTRWSALASATILAVLWAFWHAPFFFYRFQFGTGEVIGLLVGLLAGSIWLAFLYNATGGSVLATMSWHTTWNIVNILAMLASTALLSMLSAEVMIAAIVVALMWRSGRRSSHAKRTADLEQPETQQLAVPQAVH